MLYFMTMFICNLLIPLAMLIGGYCMAKKPPKKINGFIGYRTKMSKKNMDTWTFAHDYCGRLWLKLGKLLVAGSVLIQIPFIHSGENVIGILTIVLETAQIAVILASVVKVEKALKKTFDESGIRR